MKENNPHKKTGRQIYISGPMTGLPGNNFAAFDAAAENLSQSGWTVVSPADIARREGVSGNPPPPAPADLRLIQKEDIRALLECDAIYMLNGWTKSEGAKIEKSLAGWLGLDVIFEQGGAPSYSAGVDPKGEAGDKKAPLGLLPPVAMEQAAWVHKLGADKYGPWNWRKTKVKASTYISAIMRHLSLGWVQGEDNDPESGKSHLAHIIAGCNILLDAQHHGCLEDDRPPRT